MKTVEVLAEDQIRIGRRNYRLTRFDPALPNHSALSVDTASEPKSEYQDKFRLEDMREVYARDFPPDFSISVYEPRVGDGAISYLTLRNTGPTPESLTCLQHYYQDWMHAENLHHFYKKLSDKLTSTLPGCTGIETNADELSISLWATCRISDSEDLFTHISRVGHIMESELRALSIDANARLTDLGNSKHKQVTQTLKPDESGYKWWLRYVVLPLAVATIGALIVAILK